MRTTLLAAAMFLPVAGMAEEIAVRQAQEIVTATERINGRDPQNPRIVQRFGTQRTHVILEGALKVTPAYQRHFPDAPADLFRLPEGVPPAAEGATQGPDGILAWESPLYESG